MGLKHDTNIFGGNGLPVNQHLSPLLCMLTACFLLSAAVKAKEEHWEPQLSLQVTACDVSDISSVFWFAGERVVHRKNEKTNSRHCRGCAFEPL